MPVRILIVDDEPHIRKVMRMTLESSGYEVSEAASGEEALELANAPAAWNVVLLDERMPGIDGLETLRRLRARDPEAVVIMVTAYASIELAVNAMKLGATDFVRKPMSPDTLRMAVDGALAKAQGTWQPEPAPPDPYAGGEGRFQVWVLNGFRVVHAADGDSPSEHRFDVGRREPGTVRRVVVQFTPGVVAAASAEAERPLEQDGEFWRRQGGLALAHYVWTHADIPPDGRLVVSELSKDLIKGARGAAT